MSIILHHRFNFHAALLQAQCRLATFTSIFNFLYNFIQNFRIKIRIKIKKMTWNVTLHEYIFMLVTYWINTIGYFSR